MESVDFYLKHLVGHFDNSQAELMRDCDDVLKQSDDALSKNAVAASTSEKNGDAAAAATDDGDDDEENDDEETKRQLESLKEKFRIDEEKRKERMERERREWIEAERQREEERLSRERELVAERERLDREHKVGNGRRGRGGKIFYASCVVGCYGAIARGIGKREDGYARRASTARSIYNPVGYC